MKATETIARLSRNAGGVFTVVAGLSRALATLPETDISVVGAADEFAEADRAAWNPCNVTALPCAAFARKFVYTPALFEKLCALNPDIVHCHGIWTHHCWATLRWSRRTRRPYVVSIHGMLDAVDLAKSRAVKFIARRLFMDQMLQGAACIAVNSEPEAQSIRAFGLRNPICLIPNGIDPPPATEAPAPWSGSIPAGSKVLFYIGRLNRKKGVHFLLDGWAAATRNNPAAEEWRVVIAGWDQDGYAHELKAQAKALGIESTVHFAGPLFDQAKAAAFANADAFVLPSTSEGLPTVVLEAWSSGLPVLMTDPCNIPEGFAAGAALRVETRGEDVARGLRELFSMTDAQRREMGAKGRALTQQRFAWPAVAGQVKHVYDWLLGKAAVPDCVRLK